jgi:hypothetical protein
MASGVVGKRPGEFGGKPGRFTNSIEVNGAIKGVLPPHQERQALWETDSADVASKPEVGTGGKATS